MLCLNYLLLWVGVGMILIASAILSYDFHRNLRQKSALRMPAVASIQATRWRTGVALALLAWAPMVLGLGIIMIAGAISGAPMR